MKYRVLLLLAIIMTILIGSLVAVNASDSGTCGEKLTWSLDDNGNLIVEGNGAMDDWVRPTLTAPWSDYSDNIISVVINDGVASIGNQAFYKFTSLNNVTIPQGITSIGYEAFYGCENLTTISIPETVNTISECAFSYCSDFSRVDIPNGVVSIGASAFSHCTNLKTISIPSSVEYIGNSVFYDCGLDTIYYDGTQEQWEKLFGENNKSLPTDIQIVCDDTVNKTVDDNTVTTSFGATVSNWAAPEIELAFENNLIPDVMLNFDLTKKVNRGEFAAIALQLYETITQSETGMPADCPFVDVNGDVNEKAIKRAYGIDLTAGTSDTTFEPVSNITREQLATMLCRVIKKYKYSDWTLATDDNYIMSIEGATPFADDADISDWAKPSVYFMSLNGIVSGVGDNKFAPKNTTSQQEVSGYATATREQAIIIAQRIFENIDGIAD